MSLRDYTHAVMYHWFYMWECVCLIWAKNHGYIVHGHPYNLCNKILTN